MRSAWAFVLLAACTPVFDNPLDTASGSTFGEISATQIGVRAVEVKWPPITVPDVKAIRVLRREGEDEPVVAGEVGPGESKFVDDVAYGHTYAWTMRLVGADDSLSRESRAATLEVIATNPVPGAAELEDINLLHVSWGDPELPWVKQLRVELVEATVGGAATQGADEPITASSHDFPVTPGHSYRVQTQIVLPDGTPGPDSTQSVSDVITVPDAQPQNVGVARRAAIPKTAIVRWMPVPNASRYRVYQRPGEESDEVGTATLLEDNNWYSIEGGERIAAEFEVPEAAGTYTFRVAAVAADDFEGPRSQAATTWPTGWQLEAPAPATDVLPNGTPRGASYDREENAVYVAYSDDDSLALKIFRVRLGPYAGVKLVADTLVARNSQPGGLWAREQGRLWIVPFGIQAASASETPHLAITLDGASTPVTGFVIAGSEKPGARTRHALSFDPNLQAMYVHGGVTDGTGGLLGDFWRLELNTATTVGWQRLLDTTGNPFAAWHSLDVDDDGESFLYAPPSMFGLTTSTWTFDRSLGIFVPEGGEAQGTAPSPPLYQNPSMVLVETELGRRHVIVGGRNATEEPTDAVWSYSEAQQKWTELLPSGVGPPAGPCSSVSVGSPDLPALLVFGRGGVWLLALSPTPAWTRLDDPPAGRAGAATAVDENGHAWFAGGEVASGATQALYSYNPDRLAPWIAESQLLPPVARDSGALAIDWTRPDRALLLYGGRTPGGDRKLWRLGNARSWTALSTSAALPAREKHSAGVSKLGGRDEDPSYFVSIGGDGSATSSGEVVKVALDTGTTEVLVPALLLPKPATVSCHLPIASCLEPRGRWGVAVIEGAGSSARSKAWELDLSKPAPEWLPTREDGPGGCLEAITCVDNEFERAAYAIGSDGSGPTLWRLSLADEGTQWSRIAVAGRTPGLRTAPSLGWDPGPNALLLAFGRDDDDTLLADLWRLRLE